METTLQYLNNFMPYFTPFEWDNIVHAGPSNNMLTEFYRYNTFLIVILLSALGKFMNKVSSLSVGIGALRRLM